MGRKSCYGCPNRTMSCYASCPDYPSIVANRRAGEAKIHNYDWLEYSIAMSNAREKRMSCRTPKSARIGGCQ